MIRGDVGCWQSFEGRLDPAVLRLVGRVHMERPASEFLATGYAMPVADRDGVARTGSREDTPKNQVLADLDTPGFLVRVERSSCQPESALGINCQPVVSGDGARGAQPASRPQGDHAVR